MFKIIQLLSIFFLFSSESGALQVYPVRNHQTVSAKIAAFDLTRVFIAGDRIESVRGLDGAYQMIRDEKAGAIFIRPQTLFQHQQFSIFLATEQGNDYTLVVTPVATRADNIELKPKASDIDNTENHEVRDEIKTPMPWVQTLVADTRAMTRNELPEGWVRIENKNLNEKHPAHNVAMRPQQFWEGDGMRAEIWTINNTGKSIVTLHPRAFWQSSVVSASLSREKLKPGESVSLYRLMKPVTEIRF
jgi:type-F conjugative transfer system secretin TraK